MKRFEVGSTYSMKSICDHNCVWFVKILKRSKCYLTVKISGTIQPVRCRIKHYISGEYIYPLGRYSMAPMLKSERKI